MHLRSGPGVKAAEGDSQKLGPRKELFGQGPRMEG